jgi:hypothetical protein
MSELYTLGPGREELLPPGGKNRMPHLLGPEVPSYNNTPNNCLTGSTSRKRCAQRSARREVAVPIRRPGPPNRSIRFSTLLLAQSLSRKGFFSSALLAGLHVKAMLLDFLDDVFLLHFALEAAQSVLQGLRFLDDYFSHVKFTPNPVRIGNLRCRIYGAPPVDIIACNQPHVHGHVDRIMGIL